ncbi:MAG TPA: T9SS type A sorting domain-containing protein [Candidatus Eisenbacteria bacterium]
MVVALGLATWGPAVHAAETRQYDAIGRLIALLYQNGSSIHYTYDANGNILSIVRSLTVAGVGGSAQPPRQLALGPATPNPGSGPLAIPFAIPTRGWATLRVFDASGRLVATLADHVYDPGRYVARFSVDRWAGGVYFYRLTLGGRELSRRLVVRK